MSRPDQMRMMRWGQGFLSFKILSSSACMRILSVLSFLFTAVLFCAVDTPFSTAFSTAQAAEKRGPSGLKLPRFVSLHSDEVNVRAGPGVRYPVKWVFVRRRLPVEITAEFETWRKIRDSTGAEGWVHRAMLSGRRSIVVLEKQVTMRRSPKAGSPAVARLSPGIVAKIERCDPVWCNVETQGYDGWVRRDGIWGLYDDETPN